jgi:hypothetical protein
MNLEYSRLKQMGQQTIAIKAQRNQPPNTIATYVDRNPETGDRRLTNPDGGVVQQKWISNSQPESMPPITIGSSSAALPGFSSQKPS